MQKIKIISVLMLFLLVINGRSQSTSNNTDFPLWVNSFDKAKIIASQKDVAILLFFTGTDTCLNCSKMRQNILDTKEFITYSRNSFVMFQVDYPNSKKNNLLPSQIKKNKALVLKYNPSGKLPQIVVIDAKGNLKASANFLDIPVSEYLPQFKALLNMFK